MNLDYRAGNALETLAAAVDAVRSFQFMLTPALDRGGMGDRAEGIAALLTAPVDDMGNAIEDLWSVLDEAGDLEARDDQDEDDAAETYRDRRLMELLRRAALAEAGRPAWHDLDTIAARSHVHRSEVARVMFVLTGEDHDGSAYRAWDGDLSDGLPAHVLAGLVWETLARSDMWGRVSDATGTELPKLREIVLAMVECAPKRAANPRPFGDVLDAQAAEGEMRAKVATQDAQGPSSDALGTTLDRLRRADLGEIAREVNLEEDAVRRVLDRLLTEPRPEAETAVRNSV